MAVDFNVWEFPQMRIHNSGGTLLYDKFSSLFNDKRDKMPRRGGFALSKIRQFFHAVCLERDAGFIYGTNQALWISR